MKLIILFILIASPVWADSPSGMVTSTCYPVSHCTVVAHSSLNTSNVKYSADGQESLRSARTRKINQVTDQVVARKAVVDAITYQNLSDQVRRDSYKAQLDTMVTITTTAVNALTDVSSILDYLPPYPRF